MQAGGRADQDAAQQADIAFTQADKVFVTKGSQYYDLSLTVAQNALNSLETILKGAPRAPSPK